MELNQISRTLPEFEKGRPSPHPLLSFALSHEAAWACTTCGACIDICPVGDKPMLDIIDIRRQQVIIDGVQDEAGPWWSTYFGNDANGAPWREKPG